MLGLIIIDRAMLDSKCVYAYVYVSLVVDYIRIDRGLVYFVHMNLFQCGSSFSKITNSALIL